MSRADVLISSGITEERMSTGVPQEEIVRLELYLTAAYAEARTMRESLLKMSQQLSRKHHAAEMEVQVHLNTHIVSQGVLAAALQRGALEEEGAAR